MLDWLIYVCTETGLVVDLIIILTGVAIYLMIKEEQK
jgi:hypothetical protein